MCARLFVLFSMCTLSISVVVNRYSSTQDIVSKSKIEISPMHIVCALNDIIVISTPVINENSLYYLNRPNGKTIKLHINKPNYTDNNNIDEYDDIVVKYIKHYNPVIYPVNNYKVFNVNYGRKYGDDTDTFKEKLVDIKGNDIVIGPVNEEDHGNWVINVYNKDLNEDWIEMFQVVTIEIREIVPPHPTKPILRPGDKFHLSFAYPIKDLDSCELTAPRGTFDRFYDRPKIDLNTCGYVIPNVTKEDEGIWSIVGVGRIVYETEVHLQVDNKVT